MSKKKLALYGGKPVRESKLPPAFPGATMIGEEEKRAVMDVLNNLSLYRYHGPMASWHESGVYKPQGGDVDDGRVSTFERELAAYIGTKYALGVTSGTAALCTALAAVGVGPGDEVIVPAYTWMSTATSVVSARAVPILAEVDRSLSLDPEDFESKITRRTKAVIPVHMRGVPCRMDEIMKIANRHGLRVIEDCAQAMGATYKGQKIGSFGDIGAFSLQAFKVITGGGGGAVTSNNQETYRRAVFWHDQASFLRILKNRSWEDIDVTGPVFSGVNYIMPNIIAAIALEQLRKCEKILGMLRERKMKIKKGVSDIDGIEFREIPDPEGEAAVCLIFYLQTAAKARLFVKALCAENIDGAGYRTANLYDPDMIDGHVYVYWHTIMKKKMVTEHGCPFNCPSFKTSVEYEKNMCPRTLDLLGRSVHIDVSLLYTQEDVYSIIRGIHKVAEAVL